MLKIFVDNRCQWIMVAPSPATKRLPPMTRHPLRPLSNLLYSVAMLPGMPFPIARLLAKAAARFYFTA
jgi:hypothetical protein